MKKLKKDRFARRGWWRQHLWLYDGVLKKENWRALMVGVENNLKTIFPSLFTIFCCYFYLKCHMYVVYRWICHVTMNVLHSFYTFSWLSKKCLDGSNSSWNKCSICTCHSWGVQVKYVDNFEGSSIT